MELDRQRNNEKISLVLLIFAWFIELFAVITGLAISVMVGLDTYNKNLAITGEGQSITNSANVVIAALPFLMVSVVELAKIPVAQAVYATRQVVWRTIFFLMLLFLAGITFETALNGFERNYNNLNYQVSVVREELEAVGVREAVINEKIKKAEGLTRETVIAEFDRQNKIFLTNREAEFETLKIATSLANTNSVATALQDEINGLKERRESLVRDRNSRIDNLDKDMRNELDLSRSALSLSQEALQQDVEQKRKAFEKEVESLEKRVESARRSLELAKISREKAIKESHIFNGDRIKREEKAKVDEAQRQLNVSIDNLDAALSRLRNFSSDVISTDNIKKSNNALAEITSKYDLRRESINKEFDRKVTSLEALIAEKTEKVLEKIGLDKSDIESEKKRLNNERSRIQSNYENNLNKISAERDAQIILINEKEKAISEFEEELSNLADKRAELKQQINSKASDNQIYRIAMMFAPEADTPADVPRSTIDMVGKVWFGSLAMVIAVTGILLALASQVVKDPRQTAVKGRVSIASSLRRLILDLRKRARKPKVIEKLIEKEVEKVVHITKEVPVDKVVFKEVPVEIIKKEVVHVPVYSDDPDLIKKG
jgi:chromosome segregation ATPase